MNLQHSGYFREPIKDLPTQAEGKILTQVFLPFYSADIHNVRTTYKGEYSQHLSTHINQTNSKG